MGYTIELKVSTFVGTFEIWCPLLRGQFIHTTQHTSYRSTVAASADAAVDARSVHVAKVHIVGRVPSRRPEVAVRTEIVLRATTVKVARQGSKDF